MKRIIWIFIIMAFALNAAAKMEKGDKTISINGITTHYVVGTPKKQSKKPAVVLVHGNGGCYTDTKAVMDVMTKAGYLVYAMDSRGQGHNAPLPEYHYADMAEDVYCFIKELKLNRPVVLGFSDGGIIAIELAIAHPDCMRAIATCGANVTPTGVLPSVYADFKKSIEAAQKEGKPVPALTKMMYDEPNISDAQLATISVPALIMAGENDLIDPAHTYHIARSIKGSTMLMLGGEDHGSYVGSGLAGKCFVEFLNNLK